MTYVDIYCVICGNPSQDVDSIIEDVDKKIDLTMGTLMGTQFNIMQRRFRMDDKNQKTIPWKKKCIFLTASNAIIKNCWDDDYGFYSKDYPGKRFGKLDYLNRGLYVHEDCFNFVKNEYDIDLNYSFFSTNNAFNYKGSRSDEIPTGISNYWEQFFDVDQLVADKNNYMLLSPLDGDKKNTNRIKKTLKKYNFKKNRKGPNISATLEKEGVYRYGNDECIWKNSNKKWVKQNIEITRKKVLYDETKNKLSQIGESSSKPLFYYIHPNENYSIIIGETNLVKTIKKKKKGKTNLVKTIKDEKKTQTNL